MKTILIIALAASTVSACAQPINWNTLADSQKHVLNLNAGIAYGTTFGGGYAYHPKAIVPLLLQVDFSVPA